MPTIIALDCSLSMSRYFYDSSTHNAVIKTEQKTHKEMAEAAALKIIEHISTSYKLEYTALITFSSQPAVLCSFTRDFKLLKVALQQMKLQDKVCVENLFPFISNLVTTEWGMSMPCEVIIISDGNLKLQRRSIQSSNLSLPFEFPGRLHFLCLSSSNDLNYNMNKQKIKETIEKNAGKGSLYTLDDNFEEGKSKLDMMVATFCNQHLKMFKSKLHCGNLNSEIIIFPRPEGQKISYDATGKNFVEVGTDIHIVGFLAISVIKSPPALYRYLILPFDDESEVNADGTLASSTTPSFSVVLHGSLKIDNKVAIAKIADNWYGMISSWADNKKKSNLILSMFEVGTNPVPSIGKITDLGLMEKSPHYTGKADKSFPVTTRSVGKRSYAQNCVVWTRPTGLQTDIQKILRNAKKLPEKTNVFYKDLNRIRKAALAFGFLDLLDGISSLLERECTLLPGTAHPEATMQLSHAANELKTMKEFHTPIQPLKTDFKHHK